MNTQDIGLVRSMLQYSQLPEFAAANVEFWDMESTQDSIIFCGFTIFDGPEGFEVSVGVTSFSSNHWEPDDHDYMTLGVFKTLGDAVMHVITESVKNNVSHGLASDAEAAFSREQDAFWDEIQSELRAAQ